MVGVSTATRPAVAPAAAPTVAGPASSESATVHADWATGLREWSASTGKTHLYADPAAAWHTFANAEAFKLLGGDVRRAPDGAEFVAKIVSASAGTAWLRMKKLEGKWAYEAQENGQPASARSMGTCASCHGQSSADSVYFSPTK